jgi:BD-FAE
VTRLSFAVSRAVRPSRVGRRVALLATLAVLATCATAGSASALPYFQVNSPATPSKGVVLLIHGGAWVYTGVSQVQTLAPQVAQFLADGWTTVNTDYSPLAGSLPDVLAVYDAIRQNVGPAVPICVYGQSAGGTLALLLAESRPVSCVIDAAGPTDLGSLENVAGDYYADLLESAGIADAAWSPGLQAAQRLTAPTLAEYANGDWLVPLTQGQELRQADPAHVSLVALDPGSEMFVHTPVVPSELAFVHAGENSLLASVAGNGARAWSAPNSTAPSCLTRRATRRVTHRRRRGSHHRRSSHQKRNRRSVAPSAQC